MPHHVPYRVYQGTIAKAVTWAGSVTECRCAGARVTVFGGARVISPR